VIFVVLVDGQDLNQLRAIVEQPADLITIDRLRHPFSSLEKRF